MPSFRNGKITKTMAISMFRHEGYDRYFLGNVTFSSSNSSTQKYWANPSINYLENDWTIVLNNTEKRELYLLFIPAYSLKESDLVVRADKKELIDIQIQYNDPLFTDTRSKHMFGDYLIATITYNTL